MLPSVSEVLKELTARGAIEPDVAFRAAREVCAEELKRIRDAGGDSVPIEELVERAWSRATGGARPAPRPAAPVFDLAPPAPPAPPEEPGPLAFATEPEPGVPAVSPEPLGAPPLLVEEPPAPAAEPAVEDPFSETTGAMDLRWDRETREPFSEPHAAVVPVDAPTLPETPVVPEGPGPLSFGDAPAVPFALPAPVEEDAEGPGDETLSRLSREAEAIDLNAVFPGAGERAAVPFAVSARPEGPAAAEPEPEPFDDEEDTVLTVPGRGRRRTAGGKKGPRLGLLLATAAGLVALAGLGYLLAGLWMERDAVPPPTPVSRPRPTATPSVVAAVPAGTETLPTGEVPATGPAPVATAPAPVATVAPTAAAVPTVPPPLSWTPAVVATPVPTVASPAPAPVARSRDGLVVTRDRAGKPEVYSIHFTSYKDRASAERDLKRVSALAGRDGFVAEVDLGEKGTWYRVMIGEFPTSPEAKAARAELAAKGTPDMGWVYRVVGAEAVAPRQ